MIREPFCDVRRGISPDVARSVAIPMAGFLDVIRSSEQLSLRIIFVKSAFIPHATSVSDCCCSTRGINGSALRCECHCAPTRLGVGLARLVGRGFCAPNIRQIGCGRPPTNSSSRRRRCAEASQSHNPARLPRPQSPANRNRDRTSFIRSLARSHREQTSPQTKKISRRA